MIILILLQKLNLGLSNTKKLIKALNAEKIKNNLKPI